jgi:hypothetical protein
MEPRLTPFQADAEARILGLLARARRAVRERKAFWSQMPHMREPESALKIVADGIEIWLYEHEATFSTTTQDERFERDDYEGDDALLQAVIGRIATTLDSDPGQRM